MSLTQCLDAPLETKAQPSLPMRNSIFAMLLVASSGLSAQTTFNVDMTCAPAGFTDVFVTGPWCGWCANDTYNTMTDDDGDGIYSVSVTIDGVALGDLVEYKYAINGFADQENLVNDMVDGASCAPVTDFAGYANRQIPAGDTANDSYGTCDGTCNDGSAVSTTADVTFQVDMNDYAGAFGTVNLNGSFNAWCGGCAALTDGDADGVYDIVVALEPGTYEYKFTLDGWTAQEEFTDGDACTTTIDGFVNRTVTVTESATLPVVCYNSCDVCDGTSTGGGGETTMGVTFNVDMACATAPGATVNGATEITELFVTGPWCGWCAADGYNVMTDADGDGVFTVEIADLTGEVEYKYGINGFADQEQLVDDMVDGADCAPVTDFAGYANRLINAGSVANDIFGACALCDTTDNGGGNNGGGQDSTLTGLANLTFDEAASVLPWEAIADATLPEATLAWNENGVETGALEFGGNNTTDGVGRAYIFQYLDANVDYAGATSVTLTFDAKLASPLESAALHMQTEFPGVGTTNNFDLQTQGLNEAGWTGYSFTFDNVSGNGIFRIQFNVASGAFVGAGGIVLLDNVAIAGGGDGGGDNGGGSDATTFQVDMACATQPGAMTNGTTEIAELFVTGPWCGWCGPEGYNVLTDVDGDGVFAVEVEGLSGEIEYKYAVNAFTDQEQLVDDMVAGADCAPVTDFSGFANRLTQAGSTTNDVFGSCSACEAVEGDGCTNPSYLEFDPYATVDDGSCVTLVVYGCPYEAATNYNPLANVDNLTCEFDGTGNNTCPSDLNGDGSVTTADLLVFLVSFGELCDE